MSGETILIVEDDIALLQGVCDTLELAGYDVLSARGGEEAVALLATAMPDIVISDIMMPEMDGYELFRIVRADPRHTTVPFVFLTARSERRDVRAGMRVGADDYITKPFDEAELLDAVASRLQRSNELEAARSREFATLAGQMVSTLNHELRAPLAQLSAFTELLEDSGPDLDADEFDALLQGVHGGVSRLLHVVADVTMLADLRSGRALAAFERRACLIDDLSVILRGVAREYRQQAADENVDMEVDVPSMLPPVYGDEVFLRDALGRLLDNAIKFSQPFSGPVRFVALADDTNVLISVTDDGIGIPESKIDALFQPFRQVDREKREQQGLGNGLAICSELLQMHGGTIAASSQAGSGSVFAVELPRAPESSAANLPR